MIKILQIGMSYEVGGTEVFITNHFRALDHTKYSVDFINVHKNKNIGNAKEIEQLGGRIFTITNAKENPLLSYYELKKIIEENNYDVIHININTFANIIPLLSSKMAHAPHIILHSHNSGTGTSLFKLTLHNINRLLTERVKVDRLACSKQAGHWMFRNAPFIVFENSINSEEFKYDETERKETRESLNIPESSYVIGNIGRLHEQKNQEFLIKVFSKYLKINANSYLIIVGEGPLRNHLENLIKEYNIESQVILTGFQKQVRKYYQAMDTFCLPSIYEGLGIVGIEAQMTGLPCLFSTHCASEVSISDNNLFLPLDEELWLLSLEETRLRKEKIKRHIQPTSYNIKDNIKKLEHIYQKK